MKSYDKYKKSREKWIGDVPINWQESRFKFFLTQKAKITNISLPCGSISFGNVVYKDGEKLTEETKLAYQEVLKGEFLVNPLNLNYDLKSLRTALSNKNVIVSSGYIVLNTNQKTIREFTKWLLFVFDIRHMKTLGAGIRQTLTAKDLGNCYSYLPSLNEQTLISKYLDIEIARIDNLLFEKKKFSKLLEEKKQTLISHVVSKGLNKKVKMKSSGVEWIGDTPVDWVVKPYKYTCKIYRGKFGHRPRNDPAFYDGQYPFIQTGDVARAKDTIVKYKQTLNEKGASVSQKFPAGTLVMAIAANIGDTAILGFEAYAPDSVVGFKPRKDIDLEFLRFSLDASVQEMEKSSTQNTQANLNIERVGSVRATFPSLPEQEKIVNYIKLQSRKIDFLVEEVKNSVELLQERRTALICAAVTGKIDVREEA